MKNLVKTFAYAIIMAAPTKRKSDYMRLVAADKVEISSKSNGNC